MAIRPDRLNEPLILATGAVVIWWGRIEGLLFQELVSLRKHAVSGVAKPLQIATDRMIDQWAKAARRAAKEFPDVQAEVSAVKVEFKDCAETRHIIVHGFWAYPSPDQDPSECVLTIVKPDGDDVSLTQYQVTYQTIAEFHDRLVGLYHRLLSLTLQRPFRDLGGCPTAELSEAEANEASDPSRPHAPIRKRAIKLHRDWE